MPGLSEKPDSYKTIYYAMISAWNKGSFEDMAIVAYKNMVKFDDTHEQEDFLKGFIDYVKSGLIGAATTKALKYTDTIRNNIDGQNNNFHKGKREFPGFVMECVIAFQQDDRTEGAKLLRKAIENGAEYVHTYATDKYARDILRDASDLDDDRSASSESTSTNSTDDNNRYKKKF